VLVAQNRHQHNTGCLNNPGDNLVPPGVWQTQDLTALSGAPAAALGGIAAYLFQPDGTQHVLYVDSGSHIEDLWRDSTGWHHNGTKLPRQTPA
jgi:hypothetical protein